MLSFVLSFGLRILKQNSENLTGIDSQSSLVKKGTTPEISALLSSPTLLPLPLHL